MLNKIKLKLKLNFKTLISLYYLTIFLYILNSITLELLD